ncbi:MAG TPA: cbb3-type cytochrome c oxidase subunit I [Verrucomicrobiae bacterium]
MSSAPHTTEAVCTPEVTPAQIDASCRVPLLLIFVSSAAWLVISSILGLIASVKMHSPTLLADCRFFTFGHVQAAAFNTLLYGFIAQAAIGVMLWLIARLGRTTLVGGGFAAVGAIFWNLGVTLGLIGIMIGDGSGYEWFEFPKYAAGVLLGAYFLMGLVGGFTFASRKNEEMYPSQWFLLAALFWFPWTYATAVALIHWSPVAGVMQSIVHQWFAHNFVTVWLGSIGIATAFYFVPKISGKPLASYSYALVTFWFLLIFGGMGGMHHGMPVPAWLPSLSTVMAFLLIGPVLAFILNLQKTLFDGDGGLPKSIVLNFIIGGSVALLAGSLMKAVGSIPYINDYTYFTYFTTAQSKLFLLGFASLILLGAVYHIVPQVTGMEWPFEGAIKAHFYLAVAGTLFIVVPLAIGGVMQGGKLASTANFGDVTKAAMMAFRPSTLGDLLWLFGSMALLANIKLLIFRMVKANVVCCVCDSKTAKTREATV